MALITQRVQEDGNLVAPTFPNLLRHPDLNRPRISACRAASSTEPNLLLSISAPSFNVPEDILCPGRTTISQTPCGARRSSPRSTARRGL